MSYTLHYRRVRTAHLQKETERDKEAIRDYFLANTDTKGLLEDMHEPVEHVA